MVKLLYFMKLAELVGCSQEELAAGSGLQLTINKKFVDSASPVRDGDESLFSPKAAKYA